MNYSKTTTILIPLLVAGVVGASALAMHYKTQADRFQRALLQINSTGQETELGKAPISPAPDGTAPISAEQGIVEEVPAEEDVYARLEEMERELRDRDAMIAAMQLAQRRGSISGTNDQERATRERGDWLEELRESDPERYEEMMQRRAELRQRVQDAFARKAAHFLYRDMDHMTEDEQEAYGAMMGLLSATWSLADRIQAEDLPREERGEIRRELFENVRILQPFMENERDREFYELGRQLGYDEEGSMQFVDYINDMIDITSFSSILRGQGRGAGMGMGR